jgi:hypothetical protein
VQAWRIPSHKRILSVVKKITFVNDRISYIAPRGSGHAIAEWLSHYATSRKVSGSRPDEMTFFNLLNLSGHTIPWGPLSL